MSFNFGKKSIQIKNDKKIVINCNFSVDTDMLWHRSDSYEQILELLINQIIGYVRFACFANHNFANLINLSEYYQLISFYL